MDASTWATIVSAAAAWAAVCVALIAVWFSRSAAQAAKDQIENEQEARREAAQPVVWADIRPDTKQGTLLTLVVGNSGPSVATDVSISIEPPVPTKEAGVNWSEVAQRRLRDGILSLAPGREIAWNLGTAPSLLKDRNDETVHHVTIKANGPHGPVAPVNFGIRPRDWRESMDSPNGSLHLIRRSIDDLTEQIRLLQSQPRDTGSDEATVDITQLSSKNTTEFPASDD